MTAEARAPTTAERRTFALLAVLYAAVTLGAIPWAQVPGPRVPRFIAVCRRRGARGHLHRAAAVLRVQAHRSQRLPRSGMRISLRCRDGARSGGCVPRRARCAAFRHLADRGMDLPGVAPRDRVAIPRGRVAGAGSRGAVANWHAHAPRAPWMPRDAGGVRRNHRCCRECRGAGARGWTLHGVQPMDRRRLSRDLRPCAVPDLARPRLR